jgi:hypothetical protein
MQLRPFTPASDFVQDARSQLAHQPLAASSGPHQLLRKTTTAAPGRDTPAAPLQGRTQIAAAGRTGGADAPGGLAPTPAENEHLHKFECALFQLAVPQAVASAPQIPGLLEKLPRLALVRLTDAVIAFLLGMNQHTRQTPGVETARTDALRPAVVPVLGIGLRAAARLQSPQADLVRSLSTGCGRWADTASAKTLAEGLLLLADALAARGSEDRQFPLDALRQLKDCIPDAEHARAYGAWVEACIALRALPSHS